jgi:hypothetical protein
MRGSKLAAPGIAGHIAKCREFKPSFHLGTVGRVSGSHLGRAETVNSAIYILGINK